MFRDEQQTHRAIRTLLDTSGLGRYWTDTGPTEEAARIVEQRGGALSAGEALLVVVGFDLWNGHGGADFGRVAHTLGSDALAALGSLLVAMSNPDEGAIDGWIARTARPSSPR